MERQTVQVHGKRLKTGFTTGTAATAALYAACVLLKEGKSLSEVSVSLPQGKTIDISIHTLTGHYETATASVIKDAGDDCDVTHQLEIGVRLTLDHHTGVLSFKGGEGVGRVTKKGLSVQVGEPAINPVPREMLTQHFRKVFGENTGGIIEVFVPKGAEAALKTLNGKLGIEGGISIIGTTGIVSPMSEEAYKHALALELKQATIEGRKAFIFVFGNYGYAYAKSLGIPENHILKTSNFIGFMLDEATTLGVERIVLIGNIGKLIKVSGGIFHTHSHVADGRFEILCAYLAELQAPYPLLSACLHLNTIEEAVEMLEGTGYEIVYEKLAQRAKERAEQHVRGTLKVECVLFSEKSTLLACTLPIDEIKGYIYD